MGPPMSAEMGIDRETDGLFTVCENTMYDCINAVNENDPDLMRRIMDEINKHVSLSLCV